jgi:hypothetical protein
MIKSPKIKMINHSSFTMSLHEQKLPIFINKNASYIMFGIKSLYQQRINTITILLWK